MNLCCGRGPAARGRRSPRAAPAAGRVDLDKALLPALSNQAISVMCIYTMYTYTHIHIYVYIYIYYYYMAIILTLC